MASTTRTERTFRSMAEVRQAFLPRDYARRTRAQERESIHEYESELTDELVLRIRARHARRSEACRD